MRIIANFSIQRKQIEYDSPINVGVTILELRIF